MQLRCHLQPDDSQDFLEALEDGGRYARPLLVESTCEIADQFFSVVGIELPGLAEHATCGRMMLFRQAFRDVARLGSGSAPDRGGRTEGAADPFDNAFAPWTTNSLGTVGASSPRPAWPEPLRRSRSLLPPAPADACCLPTTPIASTSPRSSPRCSASISTEGGALTDRQPWSRPAAPPTTPQTSARPPTSKTRDPGGAGTSPSGSRTARPNRRVDTLISVELIAQRPSRSSCAAGSSSGSSPRGRPHPGPAGARLDLAAVEADLSPRSARTVRPPRRVATVARRAGRRDIRLHHRAERLVPAARQDSSKLARISANASSTRLGRRRTSRCDISRLGVALVCGISTPSLPAQGGQRRSLQKINRTRDNLPSSNTE